MTVSPDAAPRILIHPRCRRCESTFPRRVSMAEPCSECGALDWVEKHEPAFELVQQRSDGWYGVQDYENVHPDDEVELLIIGEWRRGTVDRLDPLGFHVVRNVAGGLEPEYRRFEDENVLWRWPGRSEKGWVGPFESREAAEAVRHDWAPGYLVCGTCGWDGWKTEIAGHYHAHHGPGSDPDALAKDEVRRRPARRIG
jgi:hypothetical protein